MMEVTTLKINLKTTTRAQLDNCLKNGICEIAYKTTKGGEKTRYCTLKKFHIEQNSVGGWIDTDYERGIIVVWDMNGDEWRGGSWVQIPINNIIHFEQLTGIAKEG